ncbi:MAG: hypothetical protein LAO55_06915 [Acidobacteriia bacterium]|nr:hypothetical protein [Terriglobia bacterium]
MKSPRRIGFAFLAAAVAMGTVAVGQKVARKAPTAEDWTALAKLPDFTGVWEIGLGGGGGAGRAGRGAPPAAPAAPGAGAAPAAGRAGGRGAGRGGGPSLTPAYADKAKTQPATPPAEENLTANCLPPGMPGIMGQPYPMEFLLTPGQVTIVIEAYNQIRHIYTDGRPLPEDPDPTFYGTSVGHWEGDTLVAETVGFAQVPRGITFPYSDRMKIVERFHLTAPDTMSIETTIVDPEALTTPYSMGARSLIRHRNWTIAEYICEENNRNSVDEKGKAGVNLANPNASAR